VSTQSFNYTTDDGSNYTVRRKTSSGQATNGSSTLLSIATIGIGRIPKTISTRYVTTTLATDPNLKKRFTVGTRATFAALRTAGAISETDQFGATLQWNVNGFYGERERSVSSFDTGQTDGDQP
jgi:hypothetical protein